VKQASFAHGNHARIRSWNKPLVSNEGKVSYSRKQRQSASLWNHYHIK